MLEKAGMDFFVVRGTTVSAEHVGGAGHAQPQGVHLPLRHFRCSSAACATYRAALHLMRSGAAGVLVGFGGGATHTTASVLGIEVPMASAVADVAEARRDYLEESGGRYVHIIADGAVGRSGRHRQGDRLRRGRRHGRLPAGPRHRGARPRLALGQRGLARARSRAASARSSSRSARWRRSCSGPSRVPDGTMNLAGGLRKAMALTGYTDLKSFQRIDLILH